MKTLTKTRKNFFSFFIFVGLINLVAINNSIIHAQKNSNIFESDSANVEEIGNSTFYSELITNTYQENLKSESEKRPAGSRIRMIISILRQPFISRKSQKEGPYDVIIVPGIPYDKEKGPCLILKARLLWAQHLISKGIAKNVIFSGSAVYSPYVESQIMALFAIELGIPAEHIFYEIKAEHSTENVVYSYRLAQKMGFNNIALATGPFQSAFLSDFVKNNSLPVSFVPITLISLQKNIRQDFSEINPSTALVNNFVSLKERESREERFQGTLGNKIDE